MKRIVLFATGLVASLGGCASLPQQRYVADDNVDHRQVAAIESAARSRGVEVHWLRFPQLRKAPADASPAPVERPGT